ncbi:MAG: FliI/YscN family ATPase [Vampirovibrionales bacterium]
MMMFQPSITHHFETLLASQKTSSQHALPFMPWQTQLLQRITQAPRLPMLGQVSRVVGLTLEVQGLSGALGDVCKVHAHVPHDVALTSPSSSVAPSEVLLEVVGIKEHTLQLMPLGDLPSVAQGASVYNTHEPFKVPVGMSLLGRVLDGLGNPIDDKGPLYPEAYMPVQTSKPPHPLKRREISEVFHTGVRAIDAFLTMGYGQRIGLFAGSGVGKSTLLGMLAKESSADINVIALVGERGREVREFVEQALGSEGMKRSVLVVATSEQSPLSKMKSALVATAIAEYFRDVQGKHVLLMMDSLTRVAMAMREVGLSIGEPPAMKGYTPSMFAFMPKLVERAGYGEQGSITALYTVLVEGDDLNEPVADTVRGLLDGHFVLSRALADKNHFPALDVGASVSRLFHTLTSPEHRAMAGKVRDWMATYKNAEDLISLGAYTAGSNPSLDVAIAKQDWIGEFLRQPLDQYATWETTWHFLKKLAQDPS